MQRRNPPSIAPRCADLCIGRVVDELPHDRWREHTTTTLLPGDPGTRDGRPASIQELGVDHRRADALVTQELLNIPKTAPALQEMEMRGERMVTRPFDEELGDPNVPSWI